MKLIKSFLVAGIISSTSLAFADVENTAKETIKDVKKEAKKAAHRVDEKACEMVNGKMECLGKKIKNRATEVKDEVKDMAE